MLLEILGIVHLTSLRNHSVAHSHRESDSVGPSSVRAFDKRPEKNEKIVDSRSLENRGVVIFPSWAGNKPETTYPYPILPFNPAGDRALEHVIPSPGQLPRSAPTKEEEALVGKGFGNTHLTKSRSRAHVDHPPS